MSLEGMIARKINNALYRKFPRLDPENIGKWKEGEPPKTVQTSNSQETLIGFFEDNGKTGYLYLLKGHNNETIAACWLYNHIPSPPLMIALAYADRGEAPPLPDNVRAAGIDPPWSSISSTSINVTWNHDESAVVVTYRKKIIGIIAWDGYAWKTYSWGLMEACKWGEPLSKEVRARYRLS